MEDALRGMSWVLLYRLSQDGASMITLMDRVQGQDMTLLICEDQDGWKFGTMQFEEWVPQESFFGTGESFVFSFGDDRVEPDVY